MHVEAAAGLPRHGATETFFSEFFPTAHGLLKGRPALWGLLQPAWLAERCPEQALVLAPGLALRNPELLPWQLLGVAVAAWGLARLRQRRFTYLRHSLLFFAGMNLSSILCHALSARGGLLWRATLQADIACTGASSLCLLLAQVAPAPGTAGAARAAGRRWWALLLALAAIAAANQWAQLPWVPEAMYLGTTALAASVTGHNLLWQYLRGRRPGQLLLLLAAAAALALMALCLPLDPALCAAAGPWLGTVPLLFFGSDLGFAAIAALEAAGAAGGVAATRKDD